MKPRTLLKLAIVAAVAAGAGLLYFSPLRDHLTRDEIRRGIESVRDVWYGPAVLAAVYAFGVLFGLPATLFILAAGVIWGWDVGGGFAMLGGLMGATLSYAIGWFVGEGVLERFGRVGKVVEQRVANASFKSFLLLRLLPIFPFAVLNYAAGVARFRYRRFIGATAIALLPGTFVFAYSADALFNGTLTEGEALKRVLIVAVLVAVVVIVPSLLKKRFASASG